MPAERPDFRYDINGLRAIAVTAVMGFHFGVPLFQGGFVGVDVFFVISGFLMTDLLLRRLETNRLSVLDFYMARVRRIVPALVVLCLGLLLFGAVALDPLTLQELAKEAASALAFYSNILFATQSGYFGAPPASHWLLHTWSLSVEWQFYIVYPLVFWGAAKLRLSRQAILWLLIIGLVASFGLAEFLSTKHGAGPTWSFYSLPTRAWEMLSGGVVALLSRFWAPSRRLGLVLHYLGLLAIVLSAVFMKGYFAWPSAYTLFPVLATALVILANVNTRWSTLYPVELMGRWSYSTYLWHWPLVAGLAYFGFESSAPVKILVVAVSIVLGFASYELAETRFRQFVFSHRRWLGRAVVVAAPVLLFAAGAWASTGFEAIRSPPAARPTMLAARKAMGDWAYPKACGQPMRKSGALDFCYVGDPAARDVLVIGDSHAQQMTPRYSNLLAKAPGKGALFLTRSGCLPLPGMDRLRTGSDCAKFVAEAYRYAERSNYKRIVFVSMWPGYFEDRPTQGQPRDLCFVTPRGCLPYAHDDEFSTAFDRVLNGFGSEIAKLEVEGKQVFVSNAAPYSDAVDPAQTYRAAFFRQTLSQTISRRSFELSSAFVRNRIMETSRRNGATLLEPLDSLCTADACAAFENGNPLYEDRAHFRASVVDEPRFAFLDEAIAPWTRHPENQPHDGLASPR